MLKSINKALYGPTAEERVKAWQQKLKTQQRGLDREIRQVSRIMLPPLIGWINQSSFNDVDNDGPEQGQSIS